MNCELRIMNCFSVAFSAKGLILLLLAKHHLLVACHNAVADVGKSSAADTDGVHLCHLISNGTELRHRAKGLSFEVEVQTCHYNADSSGCQLVADLYNMLIKELSLVNAYHIALLPHEQDAGRGINWCGEDAVALMTDHFLLAIADIYGRLENLYPLLCKLCPAQTADELLCLAREHRAAYDLHTASAHHLTIA